MLDIVAPFLAAAGIAHARLDGSMSAEARAAAVQRFTHDPACTVFALSLKAGGVGLHLVAATHVWLLDPCAPACALRIRIRIAKPILTLRARFFSRAPGGGTPWWSSRRSSGATGWARRCR